MKGSSSIRSPMSVSMLSTSSVSKQSRPVKIQYLQKIYNENSTVVFERLLLWRQEGVTPTVPKYRTSCAVREWCSQSSTPRRPPDAGRAQRVLHKRRESNKQQKAVAREPPEQSSSPSSRRGNEKRLEPYDRGLSAFWAPVTTVRLR